MANLPLAFAEAGIGAILLVAGVSGSALGDVIRGNVTMHPLVGADSASASGTGGVATLDPSGATSGSNGTSSAGGAPSGYQGGGGTAADQQAFGKYLAQYTGLDPQFVQAWLLHEQPAGSPSYNGSNNWLNVGAISGNSADWTHDYWWIAQMPAKAAAAATAAWLKVNQPGILAAKGQGAAAQVTALENSGWAGSHYYYESPSAFLGV